MGRGGRSRGGSVRDYGRPPRAPTEASAQSRYGYFAFGPCGFGGFPTWPGGVTGGPGGFAWPGGVAGGPCLGFAWPGGGAGLPWGLVFA